MKDLALARSLCLCMCMHVFSRLVKTKIYQDYQGCVLVRNSNMRDSRVGHVSDLETNIGVVFLSKLGMFV